MAPCNIGGVGMCCKICGMGPCRLTKDGQTGVCGATIDTIQARNFIRAIAAGAAAHSDHGRDMAFTLKAVANDEAEGYVIRDVAKLRTVAAQYDIPIEGRSPEEIANDLADLYIAQFGQQRGQIVPIIRAPEKRQKLWSERGVVPRGIDREVVEALHRTHIGDDQDPEHILQHAVRTALADGWGGSMIATDISDILFGTPAPILGQANLGVLERGHGQRGRARPRADAERDDRGRLAGPRDHRLRPRGGRQGHQPVRHLLHGQRNPDAPGHPGGRQLPAPGAGHPDRRRRGHGGGRAVHHAGAGRAGGATSTPRSSPPPPR